jgi:hypothetical protein
MAPAQKKGSADKAWTQRGASPVEGEIATPIAKTPVPRTTSATAMIRRPTRRRMKLTSADYWPSSRAA